MKNQIKTIVLLGALSALLIGIGGMMGPRGMWLFGGLALAMNFVSYFFSDKIVLKLHRGRQVGPSEEPRLHAMVADMAQRAGLPMPKVYVLDQPTPNAFATGRNPKHAAVAVTVGLQRLLSERELRGVIAHEMAHIKNRDILIQTIAAMAATVIAMAASMARWGFILGTGRGDRDGNGGGISALILAVVAPIAATLLQLAISRSREYQADQTGAELAGDPAALADALLRLERGNQAVPSSTVAAAPATAAMFIVNPLTGGAVMSLFATHPPIEERVRKLRAMAGQRDIGRPAPAGFVLA